MNKAIVVFSGGQDSTTCLYWAKKKFDEIQAITFDYGQRHINEIEAAKKIAAMAEIDHKIIKLDFLSSQQSSLTNKDIDIEHDYEKGSLPNTFVPGRNILFLALAAINAFEEDISNLVIGVCQTDYSGYPDCRDDFIRSIENSLSLGLDRKIKIHTPLMNLNKSQTVRLAQEIGALEALALSRSCYEGVHPACGKCPACQLRLKGFEEAGIADPIEYSHND